MYGRMEVQIPAFAASVRIGVTVTFSRQPVQFRGIRRLRYAFGYRLRMLISRSGWRDTVSAGKQSPVVHTAALLTALWQGKGLTADKTGYLHVSAFHTGTDWMSPQPSDKYNLSPR